MILLPNPDEDFFQMEKIERTRTGLRKNNKKPHDNGEVKVRPTPLEFRGNAICLSGLTGTRLKSSIIGEYYPFWWGITSGGDKRYNILPTAIIEMNAATGEVYIEETDETLLGSAGHALELKVSGQWDTRNLKIVLIEENEECYGRLKKVISERWPDIPIEEAEGLTGSSSSNVYLLNLGIEQALERIRDIDLGNSLFFFDPLRSVQFSSLERVAEERIDSFYKTGTEYFVFIFTSDWFRGRDEFAPLPKSQRSDSWNEEEEKTVNQADELFGDTGWRRVILNNQPIEKKQNAMVGLYRDVLHRWFRYVLPMPFVPRANQLFHLILCSNFETGIVATKQSFYCPRAKNPRYSPNNKRAYLRFKNNHPEVSKGLRGNVKPVHWKALWTIIRQHEEGICDCLCRDLLKIRKDPEEIDRILRWLSAEGYMRAINIESPWASSVQQYILDWETIEKRLQVTKPPASVPLCPGD